MFQKQSVIAPNHVVIHVPCRYREHPVWYKATELGPNCAIAGVVAKQRAEEKDRIGRPVHVDLGNVGEMRARSLGFPHKNNSLEVFTLMMSGGHTMIRGGGRTSGAARASRHSSTGKLKGTSQYRIASSLESRQETTFSQKGKWRRTTLSSGSLTICYKRHRSPSSPRP